MSLLAGNAKLVCNHPVHESLARLQLCSVHPGERLARRSRHVVAYHERRDELRVVVVHVLVIPELS